MAQFQFVAGGNGQPMNKTSEAMGSPRNLIGVFVHCPIVPTTSENITLTLKSADGTNNDLLLVSKDLAAVTDYQEVRADCETPLLATDRLQWQYTNTDNVIVTATAIMERA